MLSQGRHSRHFLFLFSVALSAYLFTTSLLQPQPAVATSPLQGEGGTFSSDFYTFELNGADYTFENAYDTGASHLITFVEEEVSPTPRQLAIVIENFDETRYPNLEAWLEERTPWFSGTTISTQPITIDGVTGVELITEKDGVYYLSTYLLQLKKVYLINTGPFAVEPTSGTTLRRAYDTLTTSFRWLESEGEPSQVPIIGTSTTPSPTVPATSFNPPTLSFPFCGNWQITGGYWYQTPGHPDNNYNRFALDFGRLDGPTLGASVLSAHAGTVNTFYDNTGGGNGAHVIVDNVYRTMYLHLQSYVVSSGYVPERTRIATAGQSGVVTGPHIHFTLLENQTSIRPEPMSGYSNFTPYQSFDIPCPASPPPSADTVTLDAPTTISPQPSTMCESGWYQYLNQYGDTAYLTLNRHVGDPPFPITNSAQWRPNLQTAGRYRVEVLIPNHSVIQWQCPNTPIYGDTSSATYTIHGSGGTQTITLDQRPLADTWASLGEFNFDAGSGGYVDIGDGTNEASLSRTISVSAIRFVLVNASPPPTPTPPSAVITVDVPSEMYPSPSTMCDSGWYTYQNQYGHPAYLTLNRYVGDPPFPITNSALWRPNLPTTGRYRVEAFIPDHNAIQWQCPNVRIDWDTSSAPYTIHGSGGSQAVTLDQRKLRNAWASLGEFEFNAGTGGYVDIGDGTNEASLSRTISVSAMRFVLVSTPPPTPTVPPTPVPTPQKVAIYVHGWQGMVENRAENCDTHYTTYVPESNPNNRNKVKYALHELGYKVFNVYWTTEKWHTIPLAEAADCLHDQMQIIKTDWPNAEDKFLIVAHSAGGIVSRMYIEGGAREMDGGVSVPYYKHDVSQLITLGSPHGGINFLQWALEILDIPEDCEVGGIRSGTCDLSRERMDEYNEDIIQDAAVPYHLIGGDTTPGMLGGLLRPSEGENDGFIGAFSATGYTFDRFVYPFPRVREAFWGLRIDRWRTNATHSSNLPNISGNDYFRDSSTEDCIKYLVGGQSQGGCENAPSEREMSNDSILSLSPIYKGNVPANRGNQLVSVPIFIDGNAVTFLNTWRNVTNNFTLQSPSGFIVTPDTVGSLGGAYDVQVGEEVWVDSAFYQIPNPEPGEWTALLNLSNISEDAFYAVVAGMESDILLHTELPDSVIKGMPFEITTHLNRQSVGISGALVEAVLQDGINTYRVTLQETLPGIYEGTLNAPSNVALYPLIVTARGTTSFGFERESRDFLNVRDNLVTVAGTPSELAIDTNSNGQADVLRITANLESATSGMHTLVATLLSGNATPITEVRIPVSLVEGQQTLSLEFNGSEIGQSGYNGPYMVKLRVISSNPVAIVGEQNPLLITRRYKTSDFEGGIPLQPIYLPLIRR